jgi:AraC family transcriptional regulator
MSEDRLTALASQPPIKPLDVVPMYVTLSSQSHGWEGISAWRQQSPPIDELDLPPIHTYSVFLQLNSGPKLVQERYGGRHEGEWHEGDILIFQAGQPSRWRTEGPVDNLHIDLEPSFLQQIALECEMNPDHVELRDVFKTRDPDIEHIGRKLLSELQTPKLGGRLYAEALGTELAVHLLRYYCVQHPIMRSYTGGLTVAQLKRVTEYIDANLDCGVRALAEEAKMSMHHFIRAFKSSKGIPPYHYVLQRRIERAKELLKHSDLSMSEVSARTGFGTHSNFDRVFRGLTGQTPTAYRDALRTRVLRRS